MKTMKKILCALLVVLMCLASAPVGGFELTAEAADYKVGDKINFGSYPQSEVRDGATINALNKLAPSWDKWISYGYYSGNGEYGTMVQGDWMRYIDVTYNGNKYRGVKFTQYRPIETQYLSLDSYSYQDDNGYSADIVYWFEFESIEWRVLDLATGLVMCETIIDSQPYSNTIYYNNSANFRYEYFNDVLYTNYASDYETSSIRKWLNNDFYDTAFTDNEKKEINTTTLNNDGYYTSIGTIGYEDLDSVSTNDKIFLLSYNEVRNNTFGFESNSSIHDAAKKAQSSDYAKNQGLYEDNFSWHLRSPGHHSCVCCGVYDGYIRDYFVVDGIGGIRPALRLKCIFEPEPLPELKLNFEELTISNNVCPSIYVESYPDGVTKEDIVWTSSNERVAYINGSTVNPIQYGKTLITASTKDGKYSASCELTVQSSFVITSTTSSLSSIKAGEEAEYSIMLMDYEGNKLPVENVALSNESSEYLKIIKHERTETEIKLTVKGLIAGTAVLEFDNDEPLTYSKFVFDIYPATVTYRADKVPVRNEELKTNFSRAGLFVENFRYYAVGEPAEYYTALMNVYNKNSSVGIVASYTQDGKLYDIAEIKKHQAMPTDYFEFLSVLGKGAVDIALGNNYNYRYSIESTKTEIEIDVPINGYITVSNDVTSCPVTFVYGIMSLAVSTAFQLAEDLTSIEKSKESDVVKELTKKVTNYFTKDPKILDKFIKELSKKILKETTKSNITFMGEYTLDLACKIFAEIELNFEDVLKDVLLEVLKDSAHNFVSMALMKTFLSNDIIKTAEGGFIKAAEAMFTIADNVNVIDEIIDFTHSAKSGITAITFGKCNEDGFVCKDVIRVNLKEEQEILDSLYLQHYQIYIDKNQLTLRPEIKDLDLKENSVIEVHEITIMRDGVPYEIKQKVSVEIDIPDDWAIFNFKIYRVEPDGKITDMFATVANGKAYFTTDHFSEYIFVGELEADHTHSYTLKTIEPTHTQKGIKTFTCICGDTYTEEIEKLKEHTFGEEDAKCDCGFDRTEGCSCSCHKNGIAKFFFKIILFFQKIFRTNKVCKCGINHY